jgi:hypothetical protein
MKTEIIVLGTESTPSGQEIAGKLQRELEAQGFKVSKDIVYLFLYPEPKLSAEELKSVIQHFKPKLGWLNKNKPVPYWVHLQQSKRLRNLQK